jgi:hypothetical protein
MASEVGLDRVVHRDAPKVRTAIPTKVIVVLIIFVLLVFIILPVRVGL